VSDSKYLVTKVTPQGQQAVYTTNVLQRAVNMAAYELNHDAISVTIRNSGKELKPTVGKPGE
jgi:CO/xanthine dehydrogenase Mo-binding subunit